MRAVESGYIGGANPNPTYEQVCSGTTGHAEAIRIHFDPDAIGYADLLDVFFATHDPTTLNRQGNDVGSQYRSAIFPHSPEQEQAAREGIACAAGQFDQPVVTSIEPDAPWYPAEEYHQQYWDRMGTRNPYCMAVIPPKLDKLKRKFAERLEG